MAKPKSEPTPANKAVLDLRQKLELARNADKTKSTDATKKAITDLEKSLKDAVQVENRERFVTVAGGRVKTIRKAVRQLANVASPRSYKYDASDVDKAEAAMTAEVTKTVAKMRAALVSGNAAKPTDDDFTF